MNTKRLYWDNVNFQYPTRVGKSTFVGHIDPFELGVAQSNDKWIFALPSYSELIEVDNANINNLQTIINGANPNARIQFAAGTYRVGNFQTNGKPLQLVGSLDSQGNILTHFTGSQDISGNTWTADGDKFKTTVNALVNPLPSNLNEGQNGYYSGMTFQLWVNGIPKNSVPTLLDMVDVNDCYFDSATNEVYLFSIPTGQVEWGVYSHCFAQSNSNTSPLSTSVATDGLILANYTTTYYTGNRNGAVNMLRRTTLKTGNLPIKYCCVYNVKVNNCRGDAVSMPHISECRNVESFGNGKGSVIGNVITSDMYPNWDIDTAKYGTYRGCYVHNNDWGNPYDAGVGSDTIKFSGSYFFSIIDGDYTNQGKVESQRGVNSFANSIWLDFCSYFKIQNTVMGKSTAGNLYVEISFEGLVENNTFEPNSEGAFKIFNADSFNVIYKNNKIKKGAETYLIRILDSERGSTTDYPPSQLYRSENVTFENNDVEFTAIDNLSVYIEYRKDNAVAPNYENYTGKNIVIQNNNYNIQPKFSLWDGTVNEEIEGLINIQSIEDSNNIPFAWEDSSTIS